MTEPESGPGLVACEECGAPHTVRRIEAEENDEMHISCPQCGHGTFVELRDPSGR